MTAENKAELIAKAAKEFSGHAGEPVEVDCVGGCLYGFASELGCLRMFAKYNAGGATHNKGARVRKLPNRGWCFSLETLSACG